MLNSVIGSFITFIILGNPPLLILMLWTVNDSELNSTALNLMFVNSLYYLLLPLFLCGVFLLII